MFSDIFARAALITYPIIAFFAFLTLFIGVLMWVFRKGASEHYKRMSKLALADDTLKTASTEAQQ